MDKTTSLRETSPPLTIIAKTSAKQCSAEDNAFADIGGVTQKCRKGAKSQEASEVQFVEKDQEENKAALSINNSKEPDQAWETNVEIVWTWAEQGARHFWKW